jgi:hypothetical protein
MYIVYINMALDNQVIKNLLDPFTWGKTALKGKRKYHGNKNARLVTPIKNVEDLFGMTNAEATAFVYIVYMIDSFHDIDEKTSDSTSIKSLIDDVSASGKSFVKERAKYTGTPPQPPPAGARLRNPPRRFGEPYNSLEKNIYILLTVCLRGNEELAQQYMDTAGMRIFRDSESKQIKDLTGVKGNIMRLLDKHTVMSSNKDNSYVRLFKGSQPNVVDWIKGSTRSVSLDVAALPSRIRKDGREIKEYQKNERAGMIMRRELIERVFVTPAQFFDGASTIGIEDANVKYVFMKTGTSIPDSNVVNAIGGPTNISHEQCNMAHILNKFTLYSYGIGGSVAHKSLLGGGVVMMRSPNMSTNSNSTIASSIIVSTSDPVGGFTLIPKLKNIYESADKRIIYFKRAFGPSAGELAIIARHFMPSGYKEDPNEALRFTMSIFEYKRCGDGMQCVYNTLVNQLPDGIGSLYSGGGSNLVSNNKNYGSDVTGTHYLATQDYLAAAIGIMNGSAIILDGKSFGYRVYAPIWMEYEQVEFDGKDVSLFNKYKKETSELFKPGSKLNEKMKRDFKKEIDSGIFARIRPGFGSSLSKELKRIGSNIDISSLDRVTVRKLRLLMKFPTPFIQAISTAETIVNSNMPSAYTHMKLNNKINENLKKIKNAHIPEIRVENAFENAFENALENAFETTDSGNTPNKNNPVNTPNKNNPVNTPMTGVTNNTILKNLLNKSNNILRTKSNNILRKRQTRSQTRANAVKKAAEENAKANAKEKANAKVIHAAVRSRNPIPRSPLSARGGVTKKP